MARSRSGTRNRAGPASRRGATARLRAAAVQTLDPRERGAIEIPATITVKELAELLGGQPRGRHPRAHQERHLRHHQPADRPRHGLARRGELGYEVAEPRRRRTAGEEGRAGRPPEAAKEVLFEEDDESPPRRGRRS